MKEGIVKLKEAFPGDQVMEDRLEIAAYVEDASLIHGEASLVILAEGPEDIRRIISICRRHKLSFAARGRATGYTGGCVPEGNDVVISLERWRGIEHFDCLQQTIIAAPGTTIGEINAAARTAGLFFPPDPVSMEHCSIGGAFAENSSGPRCLRFGPTHQFIRNAEFFLPNGEIVMLQKDNNGTWDPFFHVLIGAEGTLGLVGRVTCELVALPKHVCLLRLEFNDAGLIPELQNRLYASHLDFSAMELITPAFSPGSGLKGRYFLYLETFCHDLETVEQDSAAIRELVRGLPIDIKPNAGDLYVRRGEGYRESRALIQDSLEHHPVAQLIDGVVPREHLGETVTALFDIAKQYRCPMLHTFHFGDGNIHPTFFHPPDSSVTERKHAILEEVTSLCLNFNGCIAGEHGIGLEKKEFMANAHSRWELDVYRNIKQRFDPLNLANPGKLVPEAETVKPVNKKKRDHPLYNVQQPVNIDALQTVAVIDPGIGCRELAERLAGEDFFFAFEGFGPKETETVETLMFKPAFNLFALRYGELRDQLTGVTYRQENGEHIKCGGYVVKNVSGYSIYRLSPGYQSGVRVSALCLRIFKPLISKPFEVSFKTWDRDWVQVLCRLSPDYYCWVRYENGTFVAVIRSELTYRKLSAELAKSIPDFSCTTVDSSSPVQRRGIDRDIEMCSAEDFVRAGQLLASGELDIYCPQMNRGFKIG
jgi:FAD/FMN-containing dehydrogenase